MPDSLVSVLLSVNRDRGGLEPTMDSILGQSLTATELIVIDDGAPEGVGKMLRRRAASDSRVRIIRNARNLGLTRSLNRGLIEARGRYVARIDEGDLWRPTKLAQQVDFLEDRSEYVLVGSRYLNYSDGDPQGQSGTRLPIEDHEIRHWLFSGLTPFLHPSVVFRRGLLSYNEAATTSQDFELYLRLSLLGKLHNLPDELVLYHRQAGGTISIDHEDVQFCNHVRMHREFMDVLRGRRDRETYVKKGTDFTGQSPFGPGRGRHMKRGLGALRRLPKRSMTRRLLRNLLIPDFLIYYLESRTAPYRLRGTFRSYQRHESHFRS